MGVPRLRLVTQYQNQRSRSRSDTLKPGYKPTRQAQTYLHELLPGGWQTFFSERRTGKYYGLTIKCPFCKALPPASVGYGARKWRWLSVHISLKHTP